MPVSVADGLELILSRSALANWGVRLGWRYRFGSLGAGAAFGFSRKLRKRIQVARKFLA